MQHNTTKTIAVFFIAAFFLLQQGCVKDTCQKTYTYTYYQPVYKTTEEVRANIKSNPAKAIVSPGKIYIKDGYIFLNELNKGIHVIDNTDPSNPKNTAFIDLPGNVDIAIKGNILYADFYTDLVAMDISNPLNVVVKKFVSNVFPERYYYGYNTNRSLVIYDWQKKTETVDCNCDGGGIIAFSNNGILASTADAGLIRASGPAPVGISGSLARFALMNDYMYAVSNDSLKVISTALPADPAKVNAVALGFGIETVYPFKDKLFIGSNNGMLIYGVQNPAAPVKLGTFSHVRTCDPVIADDSIAYVTLHSGTTCLGYTNQLDVLDIRNIQAPTLIKSYPFTSPRGLGKEGNLLFICDGNDGLKVMNAASNTAITMMKQFVMPEANDVIAYNNIALVIAKDGLYQYDYSNPAAIKLLSKISIQN
ncbi:LVIVD repeat-containing protein [Ferruginibacter sp.]